MNNPIKTIIMAGGKGTRISSLFPDIPKPLIPITDSNGISKPVLQWEIESLVSQGFTDIILTVSHMAEKIQDFFGDGSRFGVHITYFTEKQPLGNAGALFLLRQQGMIGTDPFLLLNADSVFDVDFNRMLKFHKVHSAKVTLLTHPNSHPQDSGLLVSASDGSVSNWLTKEEPRPQWYKNLVNAGLHIIDPSVLDDAVSDGRVDFSLIGKEIDGKVCKVDLDRQILKPLCRTGTMFSYCSPEYVKDMGTPERYEQVSKDFVDGVVSSKNLSNKQKAVFLDRDGTINRYVGFLRNIDDFGLLPGVAEAVRLINSSGYLCIVATNQPVIARGEVTVEELDTIHNKMETLLGLEGAYIDALYYCPHHPDKGFEGEIPELKIHCDCRKPQPGMLIQAANDYNISLEDSWMIGDGTNDVECGINAGCHTAYICSSSGEKDDRVAEKADFTGSSLLDIVKMILKMN